MLSLGALGVVFGDIGTSPLYTFSGIYAELGGQPEAEDIAGSFALIFWTLTWVTCFKYILVVMRFSHHGEGGTFALMQAIISASSGPGSKELGAGTKRLLKVLAVLGCSLLLGDGVITPVMSVLSAVEIVPVEISPAVEVPVGIIILLAIFLVQRLGSRLIGMVAGPIMLCWFLTIGAIGVYNVSTHPVAAGKAAAALNPAMIWRFFVTGHYRGFMGWRALAGVVLCVTGAEALYADMGHFGAGPITLAWFGVVYPCLVLQYLGQSAVLISDPSALQANPFRAAVPEALRWPMVVLSVIAAALASQALISGVFSILSQAYALGYFPRILIRHTNPEERGQVFVPEANSLLCVLCILLCVSFRNSGALAGAYGIAVTGTFITTTLAVWIAARHVWQRSIPTTLALVMPMLAVDIMFWTSNMMKVLPSGWVPLALAAVMCLVMLTYHWGRQREEEANTKGALSRASLAAMLASGEVLRTDAAAVFLTPSPLRLPRSLSVLASSFRSLPKVIVLFSVQVETVPFIAEDKRYRFTALPGGCGVYQMTLRLGYSEPFTSGRLAVKSRLRQAAAENLQAYPDLQLLMPEEAGSPEVSAADSQQSDDLEEGTAGFDSRDITFVVNKLHYVAAPGSSRLVEAGVKLYSSLVLNARKSISFFGLDACRAMEISSVRFM